MAAKKEKQPAKERFMKNSELLGSCFEAIVTDARKRGVETIDPNIIRIGVTLVKTTDQDKAVNTFIRHSLPHWTKMKEKDEDFFHAQAHEIFDGLPLAGDEKGKRVESFKYLFSAKGRDGNYIIDEKDRNLLWEHFHALVKISISHIYETWKRNGDKYSFEQMSIYLPEKVKEWGLDEKKFIFS